MLTVDAPNNAPMYNGNWQKWFWVLSMHNIIVWFNSPCSVHGIIDFLQLVHSYCQPSSKDVPKGLQQHVSTSPSLLQIPEFQFNFLQESIASCFIAGKPLICIKPSSLLHTPFRFHQSPRSTVEASEWVQSVYVYMCEYTCTCDVSVLIILSW